MMPFLIGCVKKIVSDSENSCEHGLLGKSSVNIMDVEHVVNVGITNGSQRARGLV